MRAIREPDRLFAWESLSDHPDLPPKASGLYAWYFDHHLRRVPRESCEWVGRRALLYVGISPSRSASGGTLRSRLRQHFSGNASGSTLRTTLAALLTGEIGYSLTRIGTRIRLSDDGERQLSDWMARHARVCWVVHRAPWEVESGIIRELSLPLNLAHNQHHLFYPELRRIRRAARARARG